MAKGNGRCIRCGQKIETPGSTSRLCYGCHLDGWLPHRFDVLEEYAKDLVEGRFNARRRPRANRAVLDAPPPPRICDAARGLSAVEIEHIGQREAARGVDDPATLAEAMGEEL